MKTKYATLLLGAALLVAASPAFAQEAPYRDHNTRANCTTYWLRNVNPNARAVLMASGPAHSPERYRFIYSRKGQSMLRVATGWCAAKGL
jgi:hypothetical protein